MSIFLSRYENKVDKKGRVSIPANYRAYLTCENFKGTIVYPSFKNECIEACSFSRLKELAKIIESLDPYSDERDAFETIVMGEAVQLSFDSEGRVFLPEHLIREVGIVSRACFVGKGSVFEIWNPDKFQKHLKLSREVAKNNRFVLKNQNIGRSDDRNH